MVSRPGCYANLPSYQRLTITDEPLNQHEQDLPGIFAEPLPVVVKVLGSSATVEAVYTNLPDIEL